MIGMVNYFIENEEIVEIVDSIKTMIRLKNEIQIYGNYGTIFVNSEKAVLLKPNEVKVEIEELYAYYGEEGRVYLKGGKNDFFEDN